MSKIIPIHDFVESDEESYKILKLNAPQEYSALEAHRHNYYEILLFDSGGGTHMIDFDSFSIHKQSLHFVSSGQIHALNRDKGVTGYVVIFSKEFLVLNSTDKLLLNDFPAFNKTASPILTMTAKTYSEILNVVKQMEAEYKMENPYKVQVLASYIIILLLKCKALLVDTAFYKNTDTASQQLMQRFNNVLEEKFITLHKVNEYASILNVTPNHLSETIKKVTGKTAGDLIHLRLILEAKRLLLHSSITTKEVAYALNFNDPSYFSRFFKANTNLSPENFRKEIRKKYHH